jgi:hypothetical protein
MLQLRARGFALRNAFADALRGLITAEEAQDYPATEPAKQPAKEPVIVRPKFDTVVQAKPATTPVPEDAVGKARLAVSRATTWDMLDAIRTLVDRRHVEGVFSDAEKTELVDLINHKGEMLTGDSGTDFPHEAAEHEVGA